MPRLARSRPCECGDPGCPVHPGVSECAKRGRRVVRRIDMDDGETRFVMCDGCAQDALDSGVFDAA
jgi:hypothetical protein